MSNAYSKWNTRLSLHLCSQRQEEWRSNARLSIRGWLPALQKSGNNPIARPCAGYGAAFHSLTFAQQYSASGEHDQPAAMLRSPHPPSTLSAVRHSSGQHEALHFNCPHHFVQLLCTQHTFYISLFVPCTHIIFHGLTPFLKKKKKLWSSEFRQGLRP